jgi:uncharacterized membrane protein
MATSKEMEQILINHEQRLKKIEKALKNQALAQKVSSDVETTKPQEEYAYERQIRSEKHTHSSKSNSPSISFTQIITVLGIIGVIIALISFYFYAVASEWIGPTGQIITGLLVGVLLGFAALKLRDSYETWSNIVFGGAFLIEYITIAVGVHTFNIISPVIALILCVILLIISYILITQKKIEAIAYFTVIGGFLVPTISGIYSVYFSLPWYMLLSILIIVLAYKENYKVLRIISFILATIFVLADLSVDYQSTGVLSAVETFQLIFVIAIFILFHVSSLLPGLNKKSLFVGDIVILCFIPFVLYGQLYTLLNVTTKTFGIIIMLISLLKIIEAFYLKQKEIAKSYLIALLASSLITLNVGLIMLTSGLNETILLTCFIIQHFVLSFFAEKTEESLLYKIFGWILLAISSFWLLVAVIIAESNLGFYTLLAGAMMIGSYVAYRKDIEERVHADATIILGFIFIIAISRYLGQILDLSSQALNITFSVLALIYSIFMYSQARSEIQNIEFKVISIILVAITIIKIAFVDLLFLEGIFRIIGFLIFGLLLLLGGYLMRK